MEEQNNMVSGGGYERILKQLQHVRRRESLALVLTRSATLLSAYCCGLLLVSAAEYLFNTGTVVRAILFWSLHGSALLVLALAVIPPLLVVLGVRRGETDFETAYTVGRHLPSVHDRLLNALQLVSAGDERLYSRELVNAAFADVVKLMDKADLRGVTDFSRPEKALLMAGGTVLVTSILFLVSAGTLSGALGRVWSHGTDFRAPSPFRLFLEPGNAEVLKGMPVSIVLRVEGRREAAVRLMARPDRQERFDALELQSVSDSVFLHEISTATNSLVYYAVSGEIETEQFRLTVLNPPLVRTMRLTVTPPRHSGLAPREQEDHHGDVTGLRGTTVAFHVEASKELSKAEIVFDDSSRHLLDIVGARASGMVLLNGTTGYRLALLDREGLENREPVHYSIKVIPDDPPRVVIESPGRDMDIAGNEDLPLTIRTMDDYGISRLRLAYRLTASRYEQPASDHTFAEIQIPEDVRAGGLVRYIWSLRELSLVPEDVISYYAEVYDNDVVSGPKTGRSEVYILRLPSLEEVFARLDEQHETGFDKLEEALRDAEEAREKVKELREELQKKQQQADWQEQRRAEELIGKYEDIQNSLAETAELVDQMMQEMQKNQLLSPETLRKYEELQQLLTEMNSPELQEALKRLQEALRQPDPEEALAAMERMNLSEEQFRKSIERTMNLLKRIQIEQKVDEAIKRMEEMLARQEEVNESTEAARDSGDRTEAEEAAREQMDLSKQMEAMDQFLKALEEMMSEFPSEMPLEALQETQALLDSSAMAEGMQELSKQMQNMQMQEAMSGQQQMSSSMQQMTDQLRQMQQMMRMNQQQEIVNDLRAVYQDLLELSKRQEEMKNETEALERNSPLFREELAGQMEALQSLGRVTDRLAEISQKSFGVTPEMGKSIGDAMAQMSGAMESLGQRNGEGAARMQEGAMGALNEAARQVQSALQAMMQGGGEGMGMAGLMQRLQGMSAMQRGINQGTRHMGSMGQRQAAEMARLAGEQGRARKSLEQLAREAARAGELSKLLGDLNRTAQEMREVQTDLAGGSIRPETLQKQERILSRLLDSQRSLQERDYEQRRKAETAGAYTRDRLPDTDLSTLEMKEQLRRDLLRAMEQGYSSDYQSIIRNYFELLEKTESPD